MDNFGREVLLGASAAAVYDALTTAQGLRGWWTSNCEVGSGVGAAVTVRFGRTFKVMRVEVLRPGVEVRWAVVDSHLHLPGMLSRTNEWTGTTIVFRLTAQSGDVTQLVVEHVGLTPEVECFDLCSQGWAQFLDSLKRYVETGTGSPYLDSPG